MILIKFVFILFISSLFAQQPNINPKASPEDVVKSNTDPNLTATATATAADDEFSQLEAEILSYLQPYEYDAKGRRDPFLPYTFDTGTYQPSTSNLGVIQVDSEEDTNNLSQSSVLYYKLQQLGLKAILWDVNKPRIIVEDPNKRRHILSLNDKIGNDGGYIAAVREGEVVIVQKVEAGGKTLVSTKYMYLKR